MKIHAFVLLIVALVFSSCIFVLSGCSEEYGDSPVLNLEQLVEQGKEKKAEADKK